MVGIVLTLFLTAHMWEHRRQEFPQNLGNARAAALLARSDTAGDLIKFAVIGDINNGTETFETVVSRLREEQNIAFLVLLGDCAADPIRDLHMYFIDEFAETGFHLPTFIVAGNHDVASGKFGYQEFEKLYGPANFAFIYYDNLFIGLGGIHDEKKCIETLSFLGKTLQEKRLLVKKAFVFMHYPPAPSNYVLPDWQEQMKEFQNLFEQYKVTYVLSGHYHRLARTDVNGVIYLVTGGGGAQLRNDRFNDIGLFHHITIIETGKNEIAEHIIPVAPAGGLSKIMERIERNGLTILLPWLERHPVAGFGLVGVIFGVFIWGTVDRWRNLARLRSRKACD
jgi:predicted phosphodiesterase